MIRKSTNDLSIKPKMSRSAIMSVIIGGGFLLFIVLYFVYEQGVRTGHKKFEQDQELISQLSSAVEANKANLAIAEEGLIISKRQQQIQEEAYKQMSLAYANSEQKNSVLGSRLDFYRSIISPEDGQSGPAIQGIETRVTEGKLSFDITLVQAIKHKHQVRGNLRATLFDGDTQVSKWPLSSDRSVNYQYFQQVSGSIDINQLASNSKLKVELTLQNGEKLERWFNLANAVVN